MIKLESVKTILPPLPTHPRLAVYIGPAFPTFDLAQVLSSATEETETSQKHIHIGHKANGFDRVTAVSPTTAMRFKAVHHGVIFAALNVRGREIHKTLFMILNK